jgi:hypothetical protein
VAACPLSGSRSESAGARFPAASMSASGNSTDRRTPSDSVRSPDSEFKDTIVLL